MNDITKTVSDYAFINEINWAFSGNGVPCCNQIMGKPGVNKGGQMVMLYAVVRYYPQAYCHQHSQVKRDPLFTTQCANEAYKLIQRIRLIFKAPFPAMDEEVDAVNIATRLLTNEPANTQLNPILNASK